MTDTTPPADGISPVVIDAATAEAKQVAYRLKGVIRELTGGWSVWASDTGTLYAVNPETISDAQLGAGFSKTIHAKDAVTLVKGIRAEMRRMTEWNAQADKAAVNA